MICAALALISDDSDRQLVAEMYERYERLMYNVALGILHDSHDAEDAVQTAFVRIINHLQKIIENGGYNHAGYFAVIARNVALNMLGDSRQTESIDDYCDLSDDVSLEADMLSRLGEEAIAKAVKSLSEVDRDIMYLHLYEKMSVKVIAELMHMQMNTVSAHIYRAKKKLAEMLRERGMNYE